MSEVERGENIMLTSDKRSTELYNAPFITRPWNVPLTYQQMW